MAYDKFDKGSGRQGRAARRDDRFGRANSDRRGGYEANRGEARADRRTGYDRGPKRVGESTDRRGARRFPDSGARGEFPKSNRSDGYSRDRFPKNDEYRRNYERNIPEKREPIRPTRPPHATYDAPFGRPETDPLTRLMNAPAAAPDAEPENMLAGRNPIREAIKAGRDIEKLMVARGDLSGSAREIVAKAREAGIVVQEVDRARLDALYKGHQGMIAFVSAASYAELDDVFAAAAERGEEPFVIVLDGITDPHNLGAIIRTAECAGAHGVIIPERRSVGLTPAAVKASAGACEYMNVVRVTNINRTLETLKERGLWVVGATMDGEDALKADLTGPMALVIGAEGEGIAELTLRKCDLRLSLPMAGHIDSLNASVAAGVMMYAVMNARRG